MKQVTPDEFKMVFDDVLLDIRRREHLALHPNETAWPEKFDMYTFHRKIVTDHVLAMIAEIPEHVKDKQ